MRRMLVFLSLVVACNSGAVNPTPTPTPIPSPIGQRSVDGVRATKTWPSGGNLTIVARYAQLEALPNVVQTGLSRHLNERLSDSVRTRLRFREARELRHGTDPSVPSFIQIAFDWSEPSAGLALFIPMMQMSGDGKVLASIELPNTRANPSKEKIVPAEEAMKVAIDRAVKSVSFRHIDMRYDPTADALMWVVDLLFASNEACKQGREFTIRADTGDFSGSEPWNEISCHGPPP